MESTKANYIRLYDTAIANLRYLPDRKVYLRASEDMCENIHSRAIHDHLNWQLFMITSTGNNPNVHQ